MDLLWNLNVMKENTICKKCSININYNFGVVLKRKTKNKLTNYNVYNNTNVLCTLVPNVLKLVEKEIILLIIILEKVFFKIL